MLAAPLADSSPVGANALLVVGPLLIVAALATWMFLTARAARKKVELPAEDAGPHRGPVQGGVIDPSADWSENPEGTTSGRPAEDDAAHRAHGRREDPPTAH
ncbi:hypothetical protein [Actinomadura flavalba]|uniref:hypothetical protein n=1 Tax=Actinomadura flavalba TaxID=1120938 RepID=UPI00036DE426|nr:hypothetical protein [Actinomadura flavalba]